MNHNKINRWLCIAIIACLVITSTPLQAIAAEINDERVMQESLTTFEEDNQNSNKLNMEDSNSEAVHEISKKKALDAGMYSEINDEEDYAQESNPVYQILEDVSSISQATDEQKELITEFYNVTEPQIVEAEQEGYSLYDSINLAMASNKFDFTIGEVITVFRKYGDILDTEEELSRFNRFAERYMITGQMYNEAKAAFIAGYSTYEVRSAYVVSLVSNLDMNSLLKTENEATLEIILNSLNMQLTQNEKDKLTLFFKEHDINKNILLNKMQQNGISVDQIVNLVDQNETDILEQYNNVKMRTMSLSEEEEIEVKFDKYYNAPYTNNIKDSENVSLNTGSLKYENTDMSLNGRNGLDLNITTRYDSSQAKLYNESYSIEALYRYRLLTQRVDYTQYNDYRGRVITGTSYYWATYGTYDTYSAAELQASLQRMSYYNGDVYEDITNNRNFQESTRTKVTYTYTDDDPYVKKDPLIENIPNSVYIMEDGYYGSISRQSSRVVSDTGYVRTPYEFYPTTKYRYTREVTTEHIYAGNLSKTSRVLVGTKYTTNNTNIETYLAKKDYINKTSGDTYNELQSCLGSGWALGFSSIEIDGSNKFLHLSNGEVYKVNITSTESDSNLEKYPLSDIQFENDNGSYSNGIKTSQYVLIHKDGLKEYFADDGRLLGIKDRFGNTIKFEHITVSEYPVISKITDTSGRIVDITYQTTGDNKEIIITAPDKSTIRYILEPIAGCTGKYNLSKKIDRLNRETEFVYDVDSGLFTFFSKDDRDKENRYANLIEIHYPTGAYSKYTYEKAVGNMGNQGSQEYFRIKTRQDIDNGKSYNKKTYDYSGNYSGYSTCNDPNSLPADFTYGVEETDAYLAKVSYTFNNKHLMSTKETKDSTAILRNRTIYEYNANKLPLKVIHRAYNKTTGQYMENVENYAYDSNAFGDVVGYWDSQSDRDSNNLPTNDEHKTTYSYNPYFHFMTSKLFKKDENTTILEEMTASSDNKSVEWQKVYENGVLKEQTRYLYDAFGNRSEVRKYLDNWNDYITDKYSYSDNDPERNGKLDGVYLTRKWVEGVKNADGILIAAKSGNSAGLVDEVNQYDIMGNLIEKQDRIGFKTSYLYDIMGRLRSETYEDGNSKKYDYNDAENSVLVTNENDDSMKYFYDGFGNLLYEQDVESTEILKQYEYDLEFKLEKESSHNNKSITSYSYTDDGRLLSKEIRGDEGTLIYAESYLYEDASNAGVYNKINKIIEGDKNSPSVTAVTYKNKHGFIEKQGKVHNGVESLDTYKYDYLGNKTEEKSARAYDENWAESYTKKYQYNHKGDILKEYNVFGDQITNVYDALGRVTKKTDIKGNKASAAYFTTYEYDNLDRLIKEKIPFEEVGGTIYYTTKEHYYDRNENIIRERTSINKPGEAETYSRLDFEYNNRDKLIKETTYNNEEPENYIQFYYDAAGNKVRMYTGLSDPLTINGLDSEAPNGDLEYSVTQYEYDRFGNQTSMIDALGKEETYEYDLNGNKVQEIDRNGNVINFDYDGMGRVLQKSVTAPDGLGNKSYSYTYTLTGNLLSSSGDSVNTTYTYDDLGNKITENMTNGITKEYDYDAADNKTLVVVRQNGSIMANTGYSYDKLNRLEQVLETGQPKATYTYDDNGNRETLAYGNGNTTVYQYNLANKLKSLTNSNNNVTLSDYTYDYYLDGNQARKNESQTNKLSEYLYDGLGRLESEIEKENGTVVSAIAYTYDDYNNRAIMTKDGVETSYNYDANSRLKTETVVSGDITEITSYEYDDNGNQIFKSAGTIEPQKEGITSNIEIAVLGVNGDGTVSLNEYDGFNQLVKVISGDITATYKYNGDGLRDSKTVNGTTVGQIWDEKEIALELDAQGAVINRYLRGINLISAEDGAGLESYYLYNGHGDVVQLTNINGTVTKSYDYDAFGVEKNPDPEDTNVFRYCGQYFDIETGTYYLQARYYDPVIGRFISADSYPGKDDDPLSLNLYTYCSNNPIMYIDEDGHIAILATILIGAAVGAFISAGVSIGYQYYFNNGQIDWGDVGIAAGAGAISGALAGSGIGWSVIPFNSAISVGQYSLTQWSNNEAITGFGLGGSFFTGGIAGMIGGRGAYPAIQNAFRPLSQVTPNVSRGVINGFIYRSPEVINYYYQPSVTSSLFRLTTANVLRTTAATGFSYVPSIFENLWPNYASYNNYSSAYTYSFNQYNNYSYFNNYYNYYYY